MAVEPTLQTVLGSKAQITTVAGQSGIFIAFSDINTATGDILPASPNAEEIIAGIVEMSCAGLSPLARDGDVFTGLLPTNPNQNVAILTYERPSNGNKPDTDAVPPAIITRNDVLLTRKTYVFQFDSPAGSARLKPSDY